MAAARYDLFIQYNGQAASNVPVARLMAGAGIKVLAIQVPVPGAPLFAVDNSASGADSGRVLAEEGKRRWPDAVPVAVIIGLPEAGPMFRERGEAAKRAIAAVYPGVTFEEFSSKSDVGHVRHGDRPPDPPCGLSDAHLGARGRGGAGRGFGHPQYGAGRRRGRLDDGRQLSGAGGA